MKGYKVFKPDWTCRGFKFEIGQEYKEDVKISVCHRGFHFCEKVADCFDYYSFDARNKVAEVEALGEVKTDGNKSCTNHIKIVRELSWQEMLDLANIGKGNTGLRNSGDMNSGDMNSGDMNSGDRNSGYMNSGDMNSGDRNSGDRNSGDRNSGDRNSGDRNSGDMNSGYMNSGDRNSGDRNSGVFNRTNYSAGAFCTEEPKVLIFDEPSNMTMREVLNSKWFSMLNWICEPTQWIDESRMTENEKKEHLKYQTTSGYLKVLDYQEAWQIGWSKMTDKEKQYIIDNVPNFNKDKFKYITGIEL